MEKERFSMLLLEPGEVYFEDFRCTLSAKSKQSKGIYESTQQAGRLKLCSKSVVFEPKDMMQPILKIMLKNCTKLELISDSKNALELLKMSSNGIIIECSQYVSMLEGNTVAPYEFHHEKVGFELFLNYSGVKDVLARITQLQRASTLPLPDQNLMISTITFSRQSRCTFDNMWLGDLYEEIILESEGKKVTPLVMNPGRIVLTSAALYFQPFNNVETHPVTKVKLEHIRRIIKRRFLLQQLGVELYCSGCAPVPHLYLTFVCSQKRDELFDAVSTQPAVHLQDEEQEAVLLQWQHGVVSNYDYLLYLNSVADRTFNDLTQYPVFPWVVADYTSDSLDFTSRSTFRDLTKPMGALNEARFKNLKERYEDMPEPKFLYGSHYSTPGFVLFYLVRKFPQYMLCLQNGRFDHPDRMFNSVADVWRNVLRSNTDFKELVPEFYDVHSKGDFLMNMYGINFGHKQDGSRVDDVDLPPWAADPSDFVKKLREALESEYVSKNLHHWIDLIFGYKQRGEEAIKANNVFYHLCYEGSVDLEGETDDVKKHALEIQIMEFGQIPKQVFDRPHPERFLARPETPLQLDPGIGAVLDANRSVLGYERTAKIKCHRGAVAAMTFVQDDVIATVGDDFMLKCHSLKNNQQVLSIPLGRAPLNGVTVLPGSTASKRLAVASQNFSVYIYDLEFGRIVEEVEAHDDAVTCIAWSKNPDGGFLVSGSKDECVHVWPGLTTGEPWRKISRICPLKLPHSSPVTCIALNGDDTQLVTGCEDGGIFAFCTKRFELLHEYKRHDGAVSAVRFNNDFRQLASCGALDGVLQIWDVSTLVSVCCKDFKEGISSFFWMHNTIVLGTIQGKVIIWDVPHASVIQSCSAHQGATLCVALSDNCDTILSGGEDGLMCVWKSCHDV